MERHGVVCIPGAGIGPEVTDAVLHILAAADAPVDFEERHAGVRALEEGDEVLPAATVEAIRAAGCMRLVPQPERFDMLLLENLHGDVVSDLCAGLVGGLGVVPGANLGDPCAVFEAVHGSAPDIAGKDITNPLALLMSSVMLLNHLAESRGCSASGAAAARIRRACDDCLAAGEKTRDLGEPPGTRSFADAVIARLAVG